MNILNRRWPVRILGVLVTILVPGVETTLAADPPAVAVLKAAGANVSKLKEGGTGVSFGNYKLDEKGWKALESLPDLKTFTIHLSAKEFGDEQLARLCEIKTIETIFFNAFGGTEAGLTALGRLPNLRRFGADHSAGTGVFLTALKDSKQFTALRLGGSVFNDEGMKALGELTQLREVNISHVRFTSAGFPNFARLVNLEKLTINPFFGPNYVSADFVHLAGLKKLDTLVISEMSLDYVDGLDHLKGLKLKLFKLHDCRISDVDLRKFESDHPVTKIERTNSIDEKFKGWDAQLEKRKKKAK
jgi:hypothetical protein